VRDRGLAPEADHVVAWWLTAFIVGSIGDPAASGAGQHPRGSRYGLDDGMTTRHGPCQRKKEGIPMARSVRKAIRILFGPSTHVPSAGPFAAYKARTELGGGAT